jgi:heptosyltransferase-2
MAVGTSSLEDKTLAGKLMQQIESRKLPVSGVKNILIRGTNWIGDAILTFAAISSIRNSYPDARIAILVKPWVADIFRLSPLVDEIIIYKSPGIHAGMFGKLRLASQLKAQQFDMVILLQNAIEAAIIAWLSRIPIRAGYNTDVRGVLLSHPVVRTKAITKVHQSYYYLAMVQSLGCVAPNQGPFLKLTAADQQQAAQLLQKQGIDENQPLIGMAPGATFGPAKKWFPDRFGFIADKFQDEFGIPTLLFGSDNDRETTRTIQKHSRYPLIDLAGKTDLRTAVALMARCMLFISNDSGLMHVAGALNLPTIAIFGSTNPKTTAPLGEKNIIMYTQADCSPCLRETCPTDFRCMDSISALAVYNQAKSIISQQRKDAVVTG